MKWGKGVDHLLSLVATDAGNLIPNLVFFEILEYNNVATGLVIHCGKITGCQRGRDVASNVVKKMHFALIHLGVVCDRPIFRLAVRELDNDGGRARLPRLVG